MLLFSTKPRAQWEAEQLEGFKKKLYEGQLRPTGFDGMEQAFIGSDNKVYYAWKEVADMPPTRQKEIENLLKWMDAGVSQKNLDQLVTAQDGFLMKALKTSKDEEKAKNLAAAMRIGDEIRTRSKEIIPEDLYYAMAAVCVAREDENPAKLDRTIHNQKQQMLKQAGRDGHLFFTAAPTFRQLLGVSLTTESALLELSIGWRMQEARLKAILDRSSAPSSSNTAKSSTSSSSVSQEQPTSHA